MSTPSPFTRLLGCALALGLSFSTHAEDWTRFRGPDGKGIASGDTIPLEWSATENIAWTSALPGRGASSPVVFGDRIYLTCFTGSAEGGEPLRRHIVCLAKEGGDEIWRHTVPAALPEQPSIREDHGYATNSVVVDAERVYAFLGKSGVIALTHSGEELWRAPVGSTIHGWGSAASPIVVEDKVIVNASVESESLIALDVRTGEEIWRLPGIKESWNTPVIATLSDGSHEIVLAMFRKVLGVDPETGEQVWECDTQINWYMCPGMIVEDGVGYAIGGRSGARAAGWRSERVDAGM